MKFSTLVKHPGVTISTSFDKNSGKILRIIYIKREGPSASLRFKSCMQEQTVQLLSNHPIDSSDKFKVPI